jgi:TPP-dependent indolepyruvate ferredoxin oxidoreductase alpha subunit
LDLLKPGNRNVTAYWLPDENGKTDKCYLYQAGNYIGSATNVENYRYNESKFEKTDEDEEKRVEQAKRRAKFVKILKDTKEDIPKLGIMNTNAVNAVNEALKSLEIIEVPALEQQEASYEFDMAGIEEFAKSIF